MWKYIVKHEKDIFCFYLQNIEYNNYRIIVSIKRNSIKKKFLNKKNEKKKK